jgi:hypothetical protein
MKLKPPRLFGPPPKARPWAPRSSRCRICMHETEQLVKGRCADRAACEERQPALFGADDVAGATP